MNPKDLVRLLMRAIGPAVAGEISVQATAGMLSHLFTLAMTGDQSELECWLTNEAVMQSWLDGQMHRVPEHADNDPLPGNCEALACTA